MYQLKGFIGIETLVSNTLGVVAPIGEISTYALTFAKEKGLYTNSVNKSLSLFSFSSKSSTDGVVVIPQTIIDMGLNISNWIYNHCMISTERELKDTFLNLYINEFILTCDSLDCGEMVETTGGYWFPEWITWKNRDYVTENNFNKVWLSDDSFRRQYDEYEIVVVPPLPNVDYFFQLSTLVATAVNDRSFSEALELIRTVRDDNPETILSAEAYDYINPNNVNDKVSTNWSVLIYGPAGNDSDIVVTALSEYILANSTHTVDEWKVIFPDIFKRTEFIFLPRWHNYAIENMVLQAGIYSPIVNLRKEIDYIKAILPEYPAAHVESHATVMHNPYKSLALDVIGGFENRENLFELNQVFADIINVSTTSNDFNRMTAKTQEFLNLLSTMIPIAESMTAFTDVPVGLRRTVRNNITYVVANYEKVKYLISTKLSTPQYA